MQLKVILLCLYKQKLKVKIALSQMDYSLKTFNTSCNKVNMVNCLPGGVFNE